MKKLIAFILLSAAFSTQAISPGEIAAAGLLQGSPALKTGDIPVVIRPGYLGSGGSITNMATSADLSAIDTAKLGTNAVVQTTGTNTTEVMSQAATSAQLTALDAAYKAADSNLQSQVDGISVTSGRQILVTATTNATDNGTALLAAYASAQAMSPVSTNEVTIVLPPETYDLGASTLNMTSEYINIIGQIPVTVCEEGVVVVGGLKGQGAVLTGEVPKTIIVSSGTAINSTIQNGMVAFVKINGDVFTAGDKAQVWQDVWFAGNVDNSSSSSNTFIRVNAPLGICGDPDYTYTGQNSFYGTIQNSTVSGTGCLGGNFGTMSGTIQNSTVSGESCLGGGYGTMALCGTIQNSIVSGDFCLGGSGTMAGTVQNSTVSGEACLGGSGTMAGTVQNSIVSGDFCLGGSGTMAGTVQNSTVSGTYCLGGGGGTMSGTVQNSTVSGDYCLGGDYGTMSGTIFRTDVFGPSQMSGASYTTNSIISFSTGIDPAVTNSVAKVFNSADSSYNLIPNQ